MGLLIMKNVKLFLVSLVAAILFSGCAGRLKYVIAQPVMDGGIASFEQNPELIWQAKLVSPPLWLRNYNPTTLLVMSWRGEIYYFDLETQAVLGNIWQPFNDPISSYYMDETQLIVGSPLHHDFVAFDFATHKRQWRKRLQILPSSVAVIDTCLYVRTEKEIIRLNRNSGAILDRRHLYDNYLPGLFSHQNFLYVITGKGELALFNYQLQDERFDFDIGEDNVHLTEQGLLVIGDSNGQLLIFDLVEKKIKFRRLLDEPIFAVPAIADGIVYVGLGDGRVVALDYVLDQTVWEFPGDGLIDAQLLLTDEVLLVPFARGEVIALNRNNGSESWRYETDDVIRSIHLNSDQLLVIDRKRVIHCLQEVN